MLSEILTPPPGGLGLRPLKKICTKNQPRFSSPCSKYHFPTTQSSGGFAQALSEHGVGTLSALLQTLTPHPMQPHYRHVYQWNTCRPQQSSLLCDCVAALHRFFVLLLSDLIIFGAG